MTKLEAAAIYAGINLLVLFALALLVVRARIKHKVMIGDGGEMGMIRAIRAHANAAEYIPAGLAGLAFVVYLDALPLWFIHLTGGALAAGRLLHALGLSSTEGRSAGRGLGTLLTWIAIACLGGGLIWAGVAPILG